MTLERTLKGLRMRGQTSLRTVFYLCLSLALATQVGCGSGDDSPGGTAGSGNASGSGGNGNSSGGGGATSTTDCAGAFATVPAPYTPNTAFDDLAVFAADAQGLVFSALPESGSPEADEVSNLLMVSDLQGKISTVRETKVGFFSNLVADGDDIIFTEGFISKRVVRMPRKGGSETVLVEDVHDGAVADDSSLYYFAFVEGGGLTLFSLPIMGGTPKPLVDRGSITLRGFVIEGDTLYWGEDALGGSDDIVSVYQMQVDASQPTLIADIPGDTAGGLNVSGGVVFSTLLTDDLDFETFRVDAGKAPAPMGETGVPFVLADGKAYYGGLRGGLTRNTLDFKTPTTVSGTSGKPIYAIGVGPTDLWYASKGCIFRTTK